MAMICSSRARRSRIWRDARSRRGRGSQPGWLSSLLLSLSTQSIFGTRLSVPLPPCPLAV